MKNLKKNEYQCAKCDGVFTKGWSDKEADEEAKQYFGVDHASKRQDFSVICDDCFQEIYPENIQN